MVVAATKTRVFLHRNMREAAQRGAVRAAAPNMLKVHRRPFAPGLLAALLVHDFGTGRHVARLKDLPALVEAGLRRVRSPLVNHASGGVMPRGPGRFDVALAAVVTTHPAARAIENLACAHARRLRLTRPPITRLHLMIVQPGATAQPWHCDGGARSGRGYATLIVPLTRDPRGSGTEFRGAGSPGGTVLLGEFGGAYCFDGGVAHRGSAHAGSAPRLFMFAVLCAGEDPNA